MAYASHATQGSINPHAPERHRNTRNIDTMGGAGGKLTGSRASILEYTALGRGSPGHAKSRSGMDCQAQVWPGLARAGFATALQDWPEWGWGVLSWAALASACMGWLGLGRAGLGWPGVDWPGLAWTGLADWPGGTERVARGIIEPV